MSSGNSSLGIIVGIDDSPAAQVAVRWAARDAELRKIPLTLVHAVSPEVATGWRCHCRRACCDGSRITGAT